nr:efflux RND transporter permease subunit [Colwellia sp.]
VVIAPNEGRETLSRFAFGRADPRFDQSKNSEMPAVTFSVAKKQGTNAVFVAEDIIERVERLEKNMIPKGVHVVITRNDGEKANTSVNNLIEHLVIAVFSVFIVCIFFLGIKEALIVGMTVPLILGLTLGVSYLAGLTINRVSLFGLILSLGLLVDSAIVVIENIHRRYQNLDGKNKSEVTILATNEIGNPTNLATFAIMLVFLSLLLITGMVGEFFYPIAFNVPVAMLSSLVVAYIVTPWAANRWLKPDEGHGLESNDKTDNLHKFYHWIITPLLSKRKVRYVSMILIICTIGVSLLQPTWQFIRSEGVSGSISSGSVALSLLPKDNNNTFNITIDMPEYTPVEVTDQVTREIGNLLRKNQYITNYQTWIGQSGIIDFNGLLKGNSNKTGPHIAEIRVNLIDKKSRDISSILLVRSLRDDILTIENRFSGSVIQLVEDPPGPPVRATLLAEIYGPDLDVMRNISAKVVEEFKKTYDVVEVKDTEVEDVLEYRLVVDKEKAALSGVSAVDVAQAISRLVNGEDYGRLHLSKEKHIVPIRLHIPRKYQIDPVLLSRVYVTNKANIKIPLSE